MLSYLLAKVTAERIARAGSETCWVTHGDDLQGKGNCRLEGVCCREIMSLFWISGCGGC
jgi:hypothetical protein